MSFDLRPYFPEDPAESQTAEGGANANDNCVPTSFAICLAALGYGDPLSPQQITDGAYGPGHIGGEDFSVVASYIESRTDIYPYLPAIEVQGLTGQEFLDACDSYGRQGFPMIGAYWCDVNATITPYPNLFMHSSPVVAFDGNIWTIWNVWSGYEQKFTNDEMIQAVTGGPGVFHRSIFPQPAPPVHHLKPEVTMESHRLDSSNLNHYEFGLYQGQPGPYPYRDWFVSVGGDTAEGTVPSVVRVYFVPADPAGAVEVDVNVAGSDETTISTPANFGGEFHVRAELISGGPVYVRVYPEFKV